MKIENIKPFVLFDGDILGIADGGTGCSQAWLISDKCFDAMIGVKFSWSTNGINSYTDHCNNFTRPTVEQVKKLINTDLLNYCIEKQFISV